MKKLLALVLTLSIMLSVIPAEASIENADIIVYISISRYGELVTGGEEDMVSLLPVELSGKEVYNLNDVFLTAHTKYYHEGEVGYESGESDWGPYVSKFWGDTSGNFGYQVNGGVESVSGLAFEVRNGDIIDFCIYKNLYPDTEAYSKFDEFEKIVNTSEEFELSLYYASGYDDSWNNIFSPCADAEILVNGEETEYVTDEEGKVLITFENEGRYIISAKKSKSLNEQTVPAITAPVCAVNVLAEQELSVMHNIAAEYKNVDIESAGGNLQWIVSDMAIYEELFPESENYISDEKKEEIAQKFAADASGLEKPGDMAKTILALRALGYDASKIYNKNFEKVNIVSKLTDLIDNGDSSVTNIYTLPYVIIALSQHSSYANSWQMEYLINSALESKEMWLDTESGTDAMTPMILALSPYCDTNNEVKTVIDSAVQILKNEQREDGLIDGFEGYESAATGLAIVALSAVGINASKVTNGGNDLISGLISTANEQQNAFPNSFATEQGFRGLLALNLLFQNKIMYDFSEYSMNELDVSGTENLPVIFKVSPAKAKVEILEVSEFSKNCFDLGVGEYTYKVSATGYKTYSGDFTVSEEEIEIREPKIIEISLEVKNSGGGGGGGMSSSGIAPKDDKEDENKEDTTPSEDLAETPENEDKTDKKVFTSDTFSDVKASDWYYDAVKYVYENSLFEGTDIGFEPNTAMSRAMLTTVLYRFSASAEKSNVSPFEDVDKKAWYSDGINWAYENNIVNGMSEKTFKPDEKITREQLALIIYNFAIYSGYDVSCGEEINLSEYTDGSKVSEWAEDAVKYLVAKDILNGKGNNMLAPHDGATRAEVAKVIMKFTEMENINENM